MRYLALVSQDVFPIYARVFGGKFRGWGADIQTRYREDAEFSLRCRMLPALAFVPPAMVMEVFEEVALILRREEPSLVSLL